MAAQATGRSLLTAAPPCPRRSRPVGYQHSRLLCGGDVLAQSLHWTARGQAEVGSSEV